MSLSPFSTCPRLWEHRIGADSWQNKPAKFQSWKASFPWNDVQVGGSKYIQMLETKDALSAVEKPSYSDLTRSYHLQLPMTSNIYNNNNNNSNNSNNNNNNNPSEVFVQSHLKERLAFPFTSKDVARASNLSDKSCIMAVKFIWFLVPSLEQASRIGGHSNLSTWKIWSPAATWKIQNMFIKNISKIHRIPQTKGSFPDLRPGWHQCHHVVAIAKWCCSVPDGHWWLMTIWQGGSAVMAVMVMIAPAFDTAKWSGVHPVVSWDLTFQVTLGTVLPPLIWNAYNRYVKTREPMRV